MTVECIENSVAILGKRLRGLAFTQDDGGRLDIEIGKKYEVFGTRSNQYGVFYLVLTDSVHTRTPWWMPAALYKVVDSNTPAEWVTKRSGVIRKDEIRSDEIYFDAIDDIEDGTKRGIEIFSEMRNRIGKAG
jgi:hypothetical protein